MPAAKTTTTTSAKKASAKKAAVKKVTAKKSPVKNTAARATKAGGATSAPAKSTAALAKKPARKATTPAPVLAVASDLPSPAPNGSHASGKRRPKQKGVHEEIYIAGAREHNLKDVTVAIPRDKLVVLCGLSGSGKSSLAFDTLYAEGQRRYVESLSAYARQFLGQMDKPDVDFISGLSPAISIDQKSTSNNPRSTVGTITEIYDYLRLLYARVGTVHCPACGRQATRQTPQQIVDRLMQLPGGTKLLVLAPVVRGRKGSYDALLGEFASQGYVRARIDGEIVELDSYAKTSRGTTDSKLARYEAHTIEVVVDRISLRSGIELRLTEALEAALGLASGIAEVQLLEDDGSDGEKLMFSEHLACVYDGISFEEPAPRNFSFNSPYGACDRCLGLGTKYQVDPDLVVPDPSLSIDKGAVVVWRGMNQGWSRIMLEALCDQEGISRKQPWSQLGDWAHDIILNKGLDEVLVKRWRGSYRYEPVVAWVERRHSTSDNDHQRETAENYMRQVPCPACKGARLKPQSLAVKIAGYSIHDLCSLPIDQIAGVVSELELSERDQIIANAVLKEITERLRFLCDVGLTYLTLSRAAGTLAGGEAQRIRLASQIGSGLVGVLYVLDEPSIGLHQRDNHRLLETLTRLRDLGNTVIVVEHDEDTIMACDYVVDVGPGAGEHGGEIVYAGPVAGLLKSRKSITGAYLSGRRRIDVPTTRRPRSENSIIIRGARQHNLTGIDVEIPLGLLVCVTGVSGSGKSTLINDILYRGLMQHVYHSKEHPGAHDRIDGLENIDKVVDIDQSPIGRTPRSNPATYTKTFDKIRTLFAATQEAKVRGYLPGRFSFNVKGGRCEACQGDGTVKIEMHFLPDVYVPCEVCKGARYNRDTLEITWKGHNIAEILDLPCEAALELFKNQPVIARQLQTIVDVGLGYVKLGQPAPTLSGGEAQRVKLAAELCKRPTGRTIYILDEPTTGLHFEDVRKLLGVLQRLVDAGNSVLVIEHNLDVIKSADWLVDLGPEGGGMGGRIVAEGTPEQVANTKASHTGRFLEPLLARQHQ